MNQMAGNPASDPRLSCLAKHARRQYKFLEFAPMSTDSSSPSPDPDIEDNLSKQANDFTEMDLWDLDAKWDTRTSPPESAEGSGGRIPTQRAFISRIQTRKPANLRPVSSAAEEKSESHPAPAEPHDSKAVIAEPSVSAPASEGPSASRKQRADKKSYISAKRPAKQTEPAKQTDAESGIEADLEAAVEIPKDVQETVVQETVVQEPDVQETHEPQKVDPAPADQSPVPAVPSIGSLSKIEKIAVFLLCSALLLGAALTLIHFSSRVPTRPLISEKVDFPVSGKIVRITAASTYWRKPITSGDNADVVRRDTLLIPVLKLSLGSKTGAIRVFFRNEEGSVVGDVITRSVEGDSEITVVATAGFEDLGMHTAYRTGSGKRWHAQVFEAPSATASRDDFTMMLEMEIDTQIR
jgi:hypothetical protein